MTTKGAKNLNTNLDSLRKRREEAEKRFERAKNDYKKIASQLTAAERRERTHKLIKLGGLCQMVYGTDIDAGLLTGILIKNKEVFASGDSEIKLLGDTCISKIEEEKRRNTL